MNWFILAFASALFSAIASIFEKKTLFKLSAVQFSFLLSLFNMVFALPFLIGTDFTFVSSASLIILYLKTILGAFAFLLVMLAIKNLDISKALPLLVLTPGIVAFFAFIFLGESLSSYEIGGMILLIAGTYILEMTFKGKLTDPFMVFIKSKNHYYIIGALILFTVTSIVDKLLLSRYNLEPYPFMGFQHIFLAVNFFIIYSIAVKKPFKSLSAVEPSTWVLIVTVAVLTIGYRYTQIEAFKIAPVALVLSVKRISVFFAAIIGGKIFEERNLLQRGIATAIMIVGAVMVLQN